MTQHINTRIRENAEDLAQALDGHMSKVFAPNDGKTLRHFSASEAAELLGVTPGFLRKLHSEGKLPEIQMSAGGRRH